MLSFMFFLFYLQEKEINIKFVTVRVVLHKLCMLENMYTRHILCGRNLEYFSSGSLLKC